MIKYTIGVFFNINLDRVVLILKNRPQWQKGLYNFPGGHIEEGETPEQGIAREFQEECVARTNPNDWKYFGSIYSTEYEVLLFTYLDINNLKIDTGEDQIVEWFDIDSLPINNVNHLEDTLKQALKYWNDYN